MTERADRNIAPDELDWEGADVQEGRQPGIVVSVRLEPADAKRVRWLADSAGLTVSQVVRRALAAYDVEEVTKPERTQYVSAFTYGGAVPVYFHHVSYVRALSQTQLPESEERRIESDAASTGTEPTRVVERLMVAG